MKSILLFLGVDRAVAYTLAGRAWTILSGLITLAFLSRYLKPIDQGFYYTFASVLALQLTFELGMSNVIMQFASHEMAHLSWAEDRTVQGDMKARSRLRSLLTLAAKWYSAISALIIVIILPAGWFFFSRNNYGASVSWQLPWVWLVLVAAMNIFLTPVFAILEGCGQVSEVARIRTFQGIGGSLTSWLLLSADEGLLAMPAMNTAVLIVGFFWLWHSYSHFFKALISDSLHNARLHWQTEIWPFQWKIAISWLSGYFIFQLFVPVLFAFRGPIEAGQMGMSISIIGAISSVAIAWINTKLPQFGHLVALKRYQELDALFFRILKQSTAVIVLGACSLLFAKIGLTYISSPLNERILPALPFALLLLTTIVNHVIFAQAAYLRSHKAEPFMAQSLTMAFLVAGSSLLVAKQLGATGMMTCYFLFSFLIGLSWSNWIFSSKRLEWHGTNLGSHIE